VLDPLSVPVPEPSRSLRVSDVELLMVFFPPQARDSGWFMELRFLEDRCDGVKGPPVAVRFSQDVQEIVTHLKAHRELAAQRARQLREFGSGPWPAGLFFGVQPRHTRRGRKEHVAAFVVLTCDLDFKDWPELPEGERARARSGSGCTPWRPAPRWWSSPGMAFTSTGCCASHCWTGAAERRSRRPSPAACAATM
jgi:hypothetical protein